MLATQLTDSSISILPNGAVGIAVGQHSKKMLGIEAVMEELGLESSEVIELFEAGLLRGNYFKTTCRYLFVPTAVQEFLGSKTYIPFEAVGTHKEQGVADVFKNKLTLNEVTKNSDTTNTIETTPKIISLAPETKDKPKSQQKVEQDKNTISLEEGLNIELTNRILESGKRVIAIHGTDMKGLKLEISKSKRALVTKKRGKTGFVRCDLANWTIDLQPELACLKKAVDDYQRIYSSLERAPTSHEFRIQRKSVETLGDVLNVHLEYNIKENKGENSGEWTVIKGLITNHLSKTQTYKLPNGCRQTAVLTELRLTDFSVATFNAYLKGFEPTNGVHDKIVSRIKAAINFCLDERLISYEASIPYLRAIKLNEERHVVIADEDLRAIFEYLDKEASPDFAFFIELGASGHFRKNQILSLKYSQFDFNHNTVTVKPKGKKQVVIQLHEELCQMVQERMRRQTKFGNNNEFLFPSSLSKSGHRETFENDWDKLRNALGFFVVNQEGKKVYKYRLHDFRETLIDRVYELEDLTLAALLGHLSLHAVKNYRKANVKRVRQGSIKSYDQLQNLKENKGLSQHYQ